MEGIFYKILDTKLGDYQHIINLEFKKLWGNYISVDFNLKIQYKTLDTRMDLTYTNKMICSRD